MSIKFSCMQTILMQAVLNDLMLHSNSSQLLITFLQMRDLLFATGTPLLVFGSSSFFKSVTGMTIRPEVSFLKEYVVGNYSIARSDHMK